MVKDMLFIFFSFAHTKLIYGFQHFSEQLLEFINIIYILRPDLVKNRLIIFITAYLLYYYVCGHQYLLKIGDKNRKN